MTCGCSCCDGDRTKPGVAVLCWLPGGAGFLADDVTSGACPVLAPKRTFVRSMTSGSERDEFGRGDAVGRSSTGCGCACVCAVGGAAVSAETCCEGEVAEGGGVFDLNPWICCVDRGCAVAEGAAG